MNNIALDLGFIQIYWYSIFIMLSIFVGLTVGFIEVRRRRIDENFFINMIFYTIIVSLIGARAYYVMFNFDYYSSHVIEIFEVWNGGLAIHGGILAGLLFILIYTKRFKVDTVKMLDICSVGLIIGQAIGRWGNFFNQEAFGPLTTKVNLLAMKIPEVIVEGMYINGEYYHPAFLYESLWNLVGFIILLIVRKKAYYIKKGQLTGIYLMWYSVGRFFIEAGRGDSLMFGTIRVAQAISIAMFLAGLWLVASKIKGSKFENLYREEVESASSF
jgi:prolipoprotein diacylglyceryl transferase